MLVLLHTIPYNLSNHLFTLCKQRLYSLKYSKHLSQVFENPSNKQMEILQTWCEETLFFLLAVTFTSVSPSFSQCEAGW